jgi:hypothetical protein
MTASVYHVTMQMARYIVTIQKQSGTADVKYESPIDDSNLQSAEHHSSSSSSPFTFSVAKCLRLVSQKI